MSLYHALSEQTRTASPKIVWKVAGGLTWRVWHDLIKKDIAEGKRIRNYYRVFIEINDQSVSVLIEYCQS
jgi:hypothetical protein